MALPFDVIISGSALESFGFVATSQFNVSGLDLNTFGFLTPCDAIWTPGDPSISTTWVDCATGMTQTIEFCSGVE